MIVVDTHILAYLYLPGDFTHRAEALLVQDADWVAPTLWRSEFRNILAGFMRRGTLTFDQAYAIQREAEELLSAGIRHAARPDSRCNTKRRRLASQVDAQPQQRGWHQGLQGIVKRSPTWNSSVR